MIIDQIIHSLYCIYTVKVPSCDQFLSGGSACGNHLLSQLSEASDHHASALKSSTEVS